MYFPIGLPQYFRLPRKSNCRKGDEIISICSNRDRSLISLLTADALHIWFCKPSVQITALRRSPQCVHAHGLNTGATWKSDATTILVTTDKGYLLIYSLEMDESSDHCLYLEKGYSKKHQKDMFLGEGIPALSLVKKSVVNIQEDIISVAYLRDELMVTTKTGSLTRLAWDGKISQSNSTHLNQVRFSLDLQHSSGERLESSDIYVSDIEYSPLLGGFVSVLSDGRGFFLTAPNARFDRHSRGGDYQSLRGVWAPDLRDAVCVHANHKYRLMVFGCTSGRGLMYHVDPATGSLQMLHQLTVSSRQFPDAGRVGGPIFRLAWTPDECAIVGAWKKGGLAVWSVFGALLYCSLHSSGLPSPAQNSCIIRAMEWGAEGYQLWMSTDRQTETASPVSSDTDNPDNSNKPWDFFQLQFVKSPLTVNPCLTNHKHLFLQGEEKLYVNLAGDTHESHDPTTNIANKQWNIIPINLTYLGTNWPIRYSAIDESGMNLAIAGRMGLAHYSLSRRRWILFGNEAQEKTMVVSGGLVWWNDFICAGCYNLSAQTDEIRFYPSNRKLDNTFSSQSKVPFAILLINTFNNLLICLCADKHIIISTVSLSEPLSGGKVDIKSVQDVSVDGYIVHPMCVTFITLSQLRTDTSQEMNDTSNSSVTPESIIINVAGRLLMFQRDWSGPQPQNRSTKYRPVPFCNPMMIASSVENVWIPTECSSNKSRPQLSESLWLSSGAGGMKVWLTLTSQNMQRHSFMSKREMLPFHIDVYPLAVLAHDAVVLGAAADNSHGDSVMTPHAVTNTDALPAITLERTRQVYLHQVLRTLLKRNLGYHALQLARCFDNLPYFSHILELLLHEVLEEEATSKEAIPDPLLPRVVAFTKEFPEYRKTVAHCARKTEIALWNHLFTAVGPPKSLFEECLVKKDLETAASYVIILHNLEKYYISRQLATLLLESALERRNWTLSKDIVRFLKRIGPLEGEVDPVTRPPPTLLKERFTTPPLDYDDTEAFSLSKPPLSRNHSLQIYDPEARRGKEKSSKTDANAAPRGSVGSHTALHQKSSGGGPDDADKFNVDLLLYRHAKQLLIQSRIRDLGLFAANIDDYKLVAFLRKESQKSAMLADIVNSLRQVHTDFGWPLPILSHSLMMRDLGRYTRPTITPHYKTIDQNRTPDCDLGDSESTREIILSPVFGGNGVSTPDPSEEQGTEQSDIAVNDDLEKSTDSLNMTRSASDTHLHMISMELANRGPQQSETELRYLYHVMLEAECYSWCLVIALVLRDNSLLSRCLRLVQSSSTPELLITHIYDLLQDFTTWYRQSCLGYKAFMEEVYDEVEELTVLVSSLTTQPGKAKSRHASRLSSHSSEDGSVDLSPETEPGPENSGNECVLM